MFLGIDKDILAKLVSRWCFSNI